MEEKKENLEEELRKHLPTQEEILEVSEAMKQLGDPSRLRDLLASVSL